MNRVPPRRGVRRPLRVLLIIENVSFARDHRARKQAYSLAAAGYRVAVVCRRDDRNQRYARDGVRLYEYPPPPEGGGAAMFAMEYSYSLLVAALMTLRALLAGAIHAIQAGHPPDIYFALGMPAKLFGTRFVVDQRDLSPEVYRDRYGTSDGTVPRVLRTLERASWRLADHVFTVNDSLVEVVSRRGGVPAERVTRVGNGPLLAAVDEQRPHPQIRGDGEFEHVVCWLGVIGPQDHLDLAIRAVAHYVHELGRNDTILVVIGDGEAAPAARALAVELDVSDFVRFTGWADERDVFAYLAAADLGIDTNLQAEVTPVKVLEYMAHRLPVVAFDLRETRLLAGDAAEYVELGNVEEFSRAVDRLLREPGECRRRGDAGRARIEAEYAWEHQAERYLDAYDRLLGVAS
jgi:glycosyltransferase involved in cell wall biosynthesis